MQFKDPYQDRVDTEGWGAPVLEPKVGLGEILVTMVANSLGSGGTPPPLAPSPPFNLFFHSEVGLSNSI